MTILLFEGKPLSLPIHFRYAYVAVRTLQLALVAPPIASVDYYKFSARLCHFSVRLVIQCCVTRCYVGLLCADGLHVPV